MSSHKTARIERVLSGALSVWGTPARVECDPGNAGGFVVHPPAGASLRIAPAAPRGWLVLRDEHLLARHAGLPGLLHTLRQELAPEAPHGRLIIGSQTLA